jgi:hypothetical protein
MIGVLTQKTLRAAAPSEVAPALGCLSSLVSPGRPERADPLRQLCAGPRRQVVARLPAHWLKQAGREPGGMYRYYKELAEELRDSQAVRPAPFSARFSFRRW